MYSVVAQLSIKDAPVPDFLGKRCHFQIDSIKADKDKLVVTYSQTGDLIPIRRAMTLKMDPPEELESIKQMLKVA